MRVDLDERLREWADDGIISAQQADAIRDRERTREGADGRSTLVAEAIGYLGAALAVVAGSLVVGEYWDRITDWGRLTLIATIGVLTFLAGWWVRDRESPAVRRLVSLLWFASAAAAAFAGAIVGADVLALSGDRTALIAGLATTVVGAGLYVLRRSALQQIALAVGIVTTVEAGIGLPFADVDVLYHGLALWGLGAAWALLAAGGWLAPQRVGEVLGLLAMGVGSQMAVFGRYEGVGYALALVTTALVGAASVVGRSTLLLGFAVAGTFLFVPQTVVHYFGDSLGAPLTLFLTGLLLIGVAVGSVVLRREIREEEPS